MFLDALLLVSDAQAFSASAVSTNTIDTGAQSFTQRLGTGEPLGFAVSIDVAADFTTGDETYTVRAIQSAAANLGTPDVISSHVISGATERAAGFSVFLPIPAGMPTKRYLGVDTVLAGTTPSVTLTAALIPAKFFADWRAYPKNYAL